MKLPAGGASATSAHCAVTSSSCAATSGNPGGVEQGTRQVTVPGCPATWELGQAEGGLHIPARCPHCRDKGHPTVTPDWLAGVVVGAVVLATPSPPPPSSWPAPSTAAAPHLDARVHGLPWGGRNEGPHPGLSACLSPLWMLGNPVALELTVLRPTLGPAHRDIRPSCARTPRSDHTSQPVAPLGKSCRLLRQQGKSCRLLQQQGKSCRLLRQQGKSCRLLRQLLALLAHFFSPQKKLDFCSEYPGALAPLLEHNAGMLGNPVALELTVLRPTLGPAHRDIRPSCARTPRSDHTSQPVAPLGMPASDGPPSRTRSTTGTSWLGPPPVAVAASACSSCPFLFPPKKTRLLL
ncbi:UNVERIFIED_CONTAM: hypothetical protein FKN15_035914 [Acipenser sinensis]